MRITASSALASGLATLAAAPAFAADEQHLSYLVTEAKFNQSIPDIALGLRNTAAVKTVAAHKLVLTGDEPKIEVDRKSVV